MVPLQLVWLSALSTPLLLEVLVEAVHAAEEVAAEQQ